MTGPTWSAPDVCRVTGVTYRQLDYWARIGLVAPTVETSGSGRPRGYTADDVVEVAVVGWLCRLASGAGLSLYRRLDVDGEVIRGPVRLTVDRDLIRSEVAAALARVRPQEPPDEVSAREAVRACLPPQLAVPA